MRLIVDDEAWQAMRAHAAGSRDEVCGALFGPPGGNATRCAPLPNVAPDPRRTFVVDDGAHLAALRRADQDGLVQRALYHSHPDGSVELSAADRRGLAFADGLPRLPGVVMIVVAVRIGCAVDVRGWSVDGPMPAPVEVKPASVW